MATSSPFRTDKELYASAALVGPVMSRSAAQQITHWARIGRELEEGGAFSTEVAEVLAGEGTPLGDHRASEAYRRAMLGTSLRKLYAEHAPATTGAAR